jgi:hypothetical protein
LNKNAQISTSKIVYRNFIINNVKFIALFHITKEIGRQQSVY